MTTTASRTVANVIAGEERPAAGGRDVREGRAGDGRGDRRRRALGAPPTSTPRWRPRGRAAGLGARDAVEQRGRSCARSRSCSSATATRSPRIVAAETGKSPKDALGETGGAIELGYFFAGEGRRFYGRTTTSATPNRHAMTVRQPLGVAGLIIAANTPIANVAWKVFPALICGNARRAEGRRGHAGDRAGFARLAPRRACRRAC